MRTGQCSPYMVAAVYTRAPDMERENTKESISMEISSECESMSSKRGLSSLMVDLAGYGPGTRVSVPEQAIYKRARSLHPISIYTFIFHRLYDNP